MTYLRTKLSLIKWETTSDKQDLLKKVPLSDVSTSAIDGGGDVAISVDETVVYQTIYGFGATLSVFF